MKRLSLFLILCFLGMNIHAQPNIDRVTLLQILAQPEKYHEKEVQIIGYLHLEFEGNGLYLHKEDFDNSILGNMIWINSTKEMIKNLDKLNDKYVIIRGLFDAKNHGHMGLFSGALSEITRCEVWSDPRKPIREKLK
ncbi:MAG: hypothetical protein R3F23_05875 [Verrucomicrobiia bacterium]